MADISSVYLAWSITSAILLSLLVAAFGPGVLSLATTSPGSRSNQDRQLTQTADEKQKKPKSWRLQGLPADLTEDNLRAQLKEAYHGVRFELHLVDQPFSKAVAIITSYQEPSSIPDGTSIDSDFEGITPLYAPKDAILDFVVVPGLSGHALGSFRAKDGWKVWLLDFLPHSMPKARVLVYGYDFSVYRNEDKSSIEDLATRLLESLRAYRERSKTLTRPIIFIGHSLGGLLIKQALVIAHDEITKSISSRDLFRSAYGLVFFGVPNLGLRHEQLLTMVGKQPNQQLIRDLIPDGDTEISPYLKLLKQQFVRVCEAQPTHFDIVCYYERNPTATVEKQPNGNWARTGEAILMVTEQSATQIGFRDNHHQNIPWGTDHRGLVKYDHAEDDRYLQVEGRLRELSAMALKVVRGRWTMTETPHVVDRVDHNVAGLLQDRLSDEVDITEDTLKEVAAKGSSGTMKMLLNQGGDVVLITEEVLKAAAENGSHGEAVMKVLLDWQADSVITEDVLIAAAKNWNRGPAVMTLLLDRCEEFDITEDVLHTATKNGLQPEALVNMLLDRRSDIAITEDVLIGATQNWNRGKSVMNLLLDRGGDTVFITENVLKMAAKNGKQPEELVNLLLDRRGNEVDITEHVLTAAAENWNRGPMVMNLLLDRGGDTVPITEDVLRAAAKNGKQAEILMELLLDRRGDEVDITENVWIAAAENWNRGKAVVCLLLDRWGDKVNITEKVLNTAAANREQSEVLVTMLQGWLNKKPAKQSTPQTS